MFQKLIRPKNHRKFKKFKIRVKRQTKRNKENKKSKKLLLKRMFKKNKL